MTSADLLYQPSTVTVCCLSALEQCFAPCYLSVETQKTSSEQIKLRNRNTEVQLELTGHFYQHPTLLHKTNPAWAAEPRWKWLSCLKTASRVNVSVLKTWGLQARATPASREGKLRSSRSFILPLNWQNRGTIYASKGSSAGGELSASPHHTPSIDSQQRVTSCLENASTAPEASVFLPPIIPRTADCRRISHPLSILISSNERGWALAAVPPSHIHPQQSTKLTSAPCFTVQLLLMWKKSTHSSPESRNCVWDSHTVAYVTVQVNHLRLYYCIFTETVFTSH